MADIKSNKMDVLKIETKINGKELIWETVQDFINSQKAIDDTPEEDTSFDGCCAE